MRCPECGATMIVEQDAGDPSVGYSGGEVRYLCLSCLEVFTEEELDKLHAETED